MRYYTYCPIVIKDADALDYAKTNAVDGHVCVINKDYTGKLYHRNVAFTVPRANSYGHDLYLFQIDTSQNETYLDCGGFN